MGSQWAMEGFEGPSSPAQPASLHQDLLGHDPRPVLSIRRPNFSRLTSQARTCQSQFVRTIDLFARDVWSLVRKFPGASSITAIMTAIDRCLASMARLSVAQMARPSTTSIPRFLAPAFVQTRQASVVRIKKVKKKRAIPKDFKRHNLDKRQFPQFTLCEAMRYA